MLAKYSLLLLSLLINSSYAQEIKIEDCLRGQKSSTIPLNIEQGPYIEGNIQLRHLDLSQEGVTLIADVAGQDRVLFRNKTGEQRFLLWLSDQKYATLTLLAANNTNLCYDMVLQYSHAQNDEKIRFNASPLSPRLQALQHGVSQSGQAPIKAFWEAVKKEGTPLIEPLDHDHSLLTFLWRGAQYNVRLVGGPSNDHEWLEKLPNTDIWFKSFTVSNNVRLSYQLAADIPRLIPQDNVSDKDNAYRQRRALLSTLVADPLNPRHFADDSLVDLAATQDVIDIKKPAVGELQQYAFSSQILGNQRRIWLYQTDKLTGRDVEMNYLYLFDGEEYLDKVAVPVLLDKLRQEGKIPPIIAVLIDNAGGDARAKELPGNPQFADMLVQELIPFVESHTGFKHNGRNTVLSGSSYGGLASAYIASRHPQYFAKVLAMSGSFWWHPDNQQGNGMATVYKKTPLLPLQWFISAGYYETARDKDDVGILESSNELATVLRDKGYAVAFKEYPGGHDYAIWQQTLADGLEVLFAQ